MMQKIVLASNNQGKLRELHQMLLPLGLDVCSQSEFGVKEVEEPYFTFVENALIKARHAAKATGLPALADDSGICVRALGGAPGVLSARYAGEPKSDQRNNEHLIEMLRPYADKSAYYYCVLVYLRHANDSEPLIAQGRWQGEIIDHPIGEGGFGYDPYFWLPDQKKTAAELSDTQKHAVSHRGQALRMLVKELHDFY
jgi:XTP/dITP diphosphohydrolase